MESIILNLLNLTGEVLPSWPPSGSTPTGTD